MKEHDKVINQKSITVSYKQLAIGKETLNDKILTNYKEVFECVNLFPPNFCDVYYKVDCTTLLIIHTM